MNDRLQQFLSAENLTQSQFADSINVARASISHILAGRNKPGFEFIENVAKRYPSLNIEWFITGKGKMYKSASEAPVAQVSPAVEDDIPTVDLFSKPVEPIKSITLDKPRQTPIKEKNISKILVFYTDGTFEEYNNNKE
ncbi:MAG: helix-turn-helix transcriptional regulator [Bacteroidales bacterium]|nr:helix-turn-helix transcriptional regulator [Bacteroidales bacterium]